MENSSSPYRFRCHEITAQQILCHCAFIITAVGRPKCFIDFVIKSALRMARADMCKTRLRPHTSDALRYHMTGCVSGQAIAIARAKDFVLTLSESICAPSFGRGTQSTRRKKRPLTAAYQDPGHETHDQRSQRFSSQRGSENRLECGTGKSYTRAIVAI